MPWALILLVFALVLAVVAAFRPRATTVPPLHVGWLALAFLVAAEILLRALP